MRYRLQLIRLDMKAAWLMFILPPVLVYSLFFLAVFRGAPEDFAENFRGITQLALPLMYLLWPAGHLIEWYDHKGTEAMRACVRGGYSCGPELCLLYLLFILLVLPLYLLAIRIRFDLWPELPRTVMQVFILQTLMYGITVLLKSISMGFMAVSAWILFSIVICREPEIMKLSLLQPYVETLEDYRMGTLAIVFCVALFLFHLTMRWERRGRIDK